MLKKEKKQGIIKEHGVHKTDTGSADVQVGLLSEEIKRVLAHLKKHKKDNHSRRGLLKMVIKRKKLLNFLKKDNMRRYNAIIKKLGLKK